MQFGIYMKALEGKGGNFLVGCTQRINPVQLAQMHEINLYHFVGSHQLRPEELDVCFVLGSRVQHPDQVVCTVCMLEGHRTYSIGQPVESSVAAWHLVYICQPSSNQQYIRFTRKIDIRDLSHRSVRNFCELQ